MFKLFCNFYTSEDGAVTVDWVVLTAAIVGLGVAVMITINGAVKDSATKIAVALNAIDPDDPY